MSIAFSNTVRAESSDRPTRYDTNKRTLPGAIPTQISFVTCIIELRYIGLPR